MIPILTRQAMTHKRQQEIKLQGNIIKFGIRMKERTSRREERLNKRIIHEMCGKNAMPRANKRTFFDPLASGDENEIQRKKEGSVEFPEKIFSFLTNHDDASLVHRLLSV